MDGSNNNYLLINYKTMIFMIIIIMRLIILWL